MPWMPGTYDPELNLLYWGTGNPNPVFAGQGRPGRQSLDRIDCGAECRHRETGLVPPAIAARHARLGQRGNAGIVRRAFNGQPRKMLAQAARNGIFTVLDRTNGKNLVTKGYVGVNWMKGVDAKGQPIPDPAKEPKVDGSLINTPGGGATNWPPPSFSPDTGLFYVNAKQGYSVTYLTDTDPEPQGYGGEAAADFPNRFWRRSTTRPAMSRGSTSTRAAASATPFPVSEHGGQAAVYRRSFGESLASDPVRGSFYGISGRARW